MQLHILQFMGTLTSQIQINISYLTLHTIKYKELLLIVTNWKFAKHEIYSSLDEFIV